jgi:predicted transcriptional regulator/transcriptional regulator with XRE-family HTH domain
MSEGPRLGTKLRALRRREDLTQRELAERLGISASYLNLIEHNNRPLTAPLLIKLAQLFQLDVTSFAADDDRRLVEDLLEVFGDPVFDDPDFTTRDLREFATIHPEMARAVVKLYGTWLRSRGTELPDAGGSDGPGIAAGRLPSEEVSDLIQDRMNYFPALEEAAERLWRDARFDANDLFAGLVGWLEDHHSIQVEVRPVGSMHGSVRRYDPRRRRLLLSRVLPPRSMNFQLAHQLALLGCGDVLDKLCSSSILDSPGSHELGRVALANYFAGAVLMPYQEFKDQAEAVRWDVELLGHHFRTSFEQVCHRMTTLRRPGNEGLPWHLVRVDIAGNISKHFSATGIRFPRFGAGCPLWNVYRAFQHPDRIRVQLSQMPDGGRFFCLARTIRRGHGGFKAAHTVHAIGLGVALEHADQLVYSDGVDLEKAARVVPIGVTCRLCPRELCEQRAFPQTGAPLRVDPNVRGSSPFVPTSR